MNSCFFLILLCLYRISLSQIADQNYQFHWKSVQQGFTEYLPFGYYNQYPVMISSVSIEPNIGILTLLPPRSIAPDISLNTYDYTYTPKQNSKFQTSFQMILRDDLGDGPWYVTTYVNITNNPPFSSPIYRQLHWNTSVLLDLFSIVQDIDNDTLSLVSVSSLQNCGTYIWDVNSNIFMFGNASTVGNCTYTCNITDGVDYIQTNITFNVEDLPPIAPNFNFSIHWNNLTTFDILSYVSDPDGDQVSFVSFGILQPNGCGYVIWNDTAQLGLFRALNTTFCTFNYVVSDGFMNSTGNVTFLSFNDAPKCSSMMIEYNKYLNSSSFDILSDCVDDDGDSINFIGYSQLEPSSCGNITWNNQSKRIDFQYNNYIGNCSFTFIVSDGLESIQSSFNIEIQNSPPTTIPKYQRIHYKSLIQGYNITNISYGDYDTDGDTLSLFGTITIFPSFINSTFYTPTSLQIQFNQDFIGNITISYQVKDGFSISNGSWIIESYDNPPSSFSKNYQFLFQDYENGLKIQNITSNIIDIDGDSMTFIVNFTSPLFENVYLNNSDLILIPNQNITSLNQVFTIQLIASDGFLNSLSTIQLWISMETKTLDPISISTHWTSFQKGYNLTQILNVPNNIELYFNSLLNLTLINSNDTILLEINDSLQEIINRNMTINFNYTNEGYIFSITIYIYIYDNSPLILNDLFYKIHWTQFKYGFLILNFSENFQDPDNDSISITISNSTVFTSYNAQDLFIKNQNNTISLGNITIDFMISDGISNIYSQIKILIYDNPPIGVADYFVITNQTQIIDVLKNDYDPDIPRFNETLKIKDIQYQGSNNITIKDNKIQIVILNNVKTIESFTYTITDGQMDSNPTFVGLYITKDDKIYLLKGSKLTNSNAKVISISYITIFLVLFTYFNLME